MSTKHLFIFGYGYTTAAVTKKLLQQNWSISTATRNQLTRRELQRLGVNAYDFEDVDSVKDGLSSATHVLSSVPPAKQGDPVMALYREHIVEAAPSWVGYLSSTGVYGDHNGEWVTEDSSVTDSPSSRTRRRIYAEHAWLRLHAEHQLAAHVFRLSGIYGPGRNTLIALKKGEAQRIHKEGQFFSRIHVEDIASVVCASMEKPNPGQIYNVSDDMPAPSDIVTEYAASLLNITPPPLTPFEDAQLSEMGREFWNSNKKVCNKRIKDELGITLTYPTYKEGLEALVKSA